MSRQLGRVTLERQRALLRQIARRQWLIECASFFALAAADCRRGRERARAGQSSLIGYLNPKVIDLLNQAQATVNPDEEDRIYRELTPIFQADLPVTFLYPSVYATVAHRRVRGLSSPYRVEPFRGFMEELWLEDGR